MIIKKCLYSVLACLILAKCSSVTKVSPAAGTTETPLPVKTDTALLPASFTPLPSVTPTQVSTLDAQQAEVAIEELLWNNPECLAPCFMELVPGQSGLEEVNTLLVHLGRQLRHTHTEGSNEFYEASYKFSSGLAISVVPMAQSAIVKNLEVYMTLPQDQSPTARREWSTYSPETLIKQYGPPSRVEFFVDRGLTPSYAINIYFDSRDFVVEYYSYDLGKNLEVCPMVNRFTFIHMWMGKDLDSPPLVGVSLEKATSMTIEEFSQLLAGDSGKACFNLNERNFP